MLNHNLHDSIPKASNDASLLACGKNPAPVEFGDSPQNTVPEAVMSRINISVVIFVSMVWQISFASADDWPQWLGPKRDSVWRESGIIDRFPDDGPKVRWRRGIGSGYAGPAVADGRVYVYDRIVDKDKPVEIPNKADSWTRVTIPGKERLLCLNESDGKVLWKYEYDCPYDIACLFAIGPRATPTVDGNRVYALGAVGNLICLDARNGKLIWERDYGDDYGLESPVWGWCSHPLIDGDKLISIVGGDGTTAVAFDKQTGKEIWRSLSSSEPGYSAPVIYNFGTHRQLIVWHADAVNGLDPETGKVYWTIPTKARSGMSIAVPRVLDDRLYVMAYRGYGAMIRLDLDNRTAELAWQADTRNGVAGSMNTPFLLDGQIYADGVSGRYTCANLDSGKREWTSYQPSTGDRPALFANVFTVKHEDRFFLANDLGDLIIAKLSPTGYEEISRAHVVEPTHEVFGRTVVWSHPAFANRSVYLRNDKEIICISLAAESP